MVDLIPASQAAEQLGCASRTVQRLCVEHGIGYRIGRIIALSADDIERLRLLVKPTRGRPPITK